MATTTHSRKLWGSKQIIARYRTLGLSALLGLFTLMLLIAYLSPFGYMGVTSVKTKAQITQKNILPMSAVLYEYRGEQYPEWSVLTGSKYPLYSVPAEDGTRHEWALIATLDDQLVFIDPDNVRDGVIEWTGDPATIEPVAQPETFTYLGTSYRDDGVVRGTAYPLYELETDGVTRKLALFKSEGDTHFFLDAENPESGIVQWQGDLASARALEQPQLFTYRGKKIPEVVLQPGATYPLYEVPTVDGGTQRWAMVQEGVGAVETYFINPDDLEAGILAWSEQPFADQQKPTDRPVRRFDAQWSNFQTAWDQMDFLQPLFNTVMIAVLGMIGTVISCTLVAYAFTRFPIPFKNVLFMVLISTIILP